MNKTPPLTMAATLRASTQGLEIIDKARCKQGWAKQWKVWADLSGTNVATLRRFWAGTPIQSKNFKAICKAVGVKEWELIIDSGSGNNSLIKSHEKHLSFAIAGSIEEINKNKLDAILGLLRILGGDTTLEILDIDEGSIKLILGGSSQGIERIEALFKSGELFREFSEAFDVSVLDVHQFDKRELIELIRKNGGSALNLRGSDLRGSDLSAADLSAADLIEANLIEANLRRANLRRANLRRANLGGADLIESDLRGADLSAAYLSGAYLIEANLFEADLFGANLFGANLFGADLRGADLSAAYLSGAYLIEANLIEADMRRANLNGANLSGAYLRRADLSGADLRKADLSGADLRKADLSGAEMNGADLSGADLLISNLFGSNLSGSNLSGACLNEADLSGAEMSGADLSRTRFGDIEGLSESDKLDMIRRGAIFEDSPGSNVPSLVKE